MPALSNSLIITLLTFAAEIVLFVFCVYRLRQPIDPLRPRIIPYNLILLFLTVAMFATLAHIVSLVTGQQLMPRRSKGMR